jgi:hypothetical protein
MTMMTNTARLLPQSMKSYDLSCFMSFSLFLLTYFIGFVLWTTYQTRHQHYDWDLFLKLDGRFGMTMQHCIYSIVYVMPSRGSY